MKHITDANLAQAINLLPTVFDTHDVIQELMRIAPRQYIADLDDTKGDDPFMTLHGQIGIKLNSIATIVKAPRISSANIRGGDNENQQWRKV